MSAAGRPRTGNWGPTTKWRAPTREWRAWSPSRNVRAEASSKALKLVLTAHKYLDDQDRETINFPDAADALLDADKFVWGAPMDPGPNEALLRDILQKRKLL